MADQTERPATIPAAPLLVGRDRERAALRAALAAALAGRGSLVLIGGEAGIGKTALAEALLAEAAAQGALVLVGRCYDLSETPPYGPWAEALARAPHGGGLPAPPDLAGGRGSASQAALFAAVRDYLAAVAATRPLTLLLDDLHWADPASLDLLRALARGLAELPLLVLATYRADELTRRHPLYQLLPTLVREARAARLHLRPLDDAAMRALVGRFALPPADAGRLVAYLHARAEGNPFYAGELLRTLEEQHALRPASDAGWVLGDLAGAGVPPLLRQIIDTRVDRLGDDVRALLVIAAVIGQEIPLSVWTATAGADEGVLLDAAERAAEARLVASSAEGVRFAHALIREALYEGIPPLRRRALHRRAAEALAAQPGPGPDAVAYHFQRAGDGRAVEWLVRAGERAQLAAARLTAAARYEAALALLEGSDGDLGERGWLRYRIARMRRTELPQRSLEYLDAALGVAAAVGDRALAAAARYSRGLCLVYQEDAAGIPELAAGCDALEALPPAEQARLDLGPDERGLPTVGNARGFLVAVLAGTGPIAAAIAMGEAARDGKPRNTPLADVAWENYGDRDHGLALAYALAGRPDEAMAAAERSRACSRAVGNDDIGNNFAFELLVVRLPYHADRPDALARVAELSATAYRRGDHRHRTYAGLAHLPLLALAGRWAEARAGGEDALRRPWGQSIFRRIVTLVLSDIARARGELDAARALIREALPAGARTPPGVQSWFVGLPLVRAAAACELDADAGQQAREWLEAHDRWLAWSGAVLGQAEGQALWARYHRQAGDAGTAHAHAARALAHASDPRQPLALLGAHRLLGELDTAAGRHADAARHLDNALALAAACAAPYERALTLLAQADLHAATGQLAEARAVLADARTILAELGAAPALARAAALDARLAAPPAPAMYPAGLSAREVEVLRLVATGLTNPEVAARLSLSPRTVGQHLRAIYAKLDVATRTAAARFATEHNLL